mmetsp:Transcript_7615/g.13440  ORF Transcript_7615/g.13440 Transcript_7615/m.13440 type:complete len:223 (+) Transcript_7615:313-981(+)
MIHTDHQTSIGQVSLAGLSTTRRYSLATPTSPTAATAPSISIPAFLRAAQLPYDVNIQQYLRLQDFLAALFRFRCWYDPAADNNVPIPTLVIRQCPTVQQSEEFQNLSNQGGFVLCENQFCHANKVGLSTFPRRRCGESVYRFAPIVVEHKLLNFLNITLLILRLGIKHGISINDLGPLHDHSGELLLSLAGEGTAVQIRAIAQYHLVRPTDATFVIFANPT